MLPSAADITSSCRNRQRSLEWPQRVLASEALRHRTMLAWQLRLAVWALRPPQWPESHRARKQAGALSRLHHFRRGLPLENEFAPSRPTSGRLCLCPCLCMRKACASQQKSLLKMYERLSNHYSLTTLAQEQAHSSFAVTNGKHNGHIITCCLAPGCSPR